MMQRSHNKNEQRGSELRSARCHWRYMPGSCKTRWSNDDFEDLSWHDCGVYGLKLENFVGDDGSADLVLDIDFAEDLVKGKNGYNLIGRRAELRFHRVFGLEMNLSYRTPTAGMCPFSIHIIEREKITFKNGYSSYRWNINVNWPSGKIEFEAPKFSQTAYGESLVIGDRN